MGVKLSRSHVWVCLLDLVYTVQPPKSGDLLKQAVIPSDLCISSFSYVRTGSGRWCVLPAWIWDEFGMFVGDGSKEMAPSTLGSLDVAPRLPSHQPLSCDLGPFQQAERGNRTLFNL